MQTAYTARFRPSIVFLHWLTLLLLAGVYACIELRSQFPRGSNTRELLKYWHFMLGLLVFGVTWIRLALRATGSSPAVTPSLPAWQAGVARVAAILLYAMMLALPVLGYLTLNAADKPLHVFGMPLPMLIAPNHDLSSQLKDVHESIATAGYFLIGLHALAALYHHYIRRDDTLQRMTLGK
jgi:cytochrome b561